MGDIKDFKLKKENGGIVPCLVKMPKDLKGIIIMVHGFTSSKSCATAELLFRSMPPTGYGVITYDQPGHGEEEALNDPLRIENCKDSLECVEKYVNENYGNVPVYYFSSSFGAYITCLYISTREHRGKKAFLRSAAVNMPELILSPLKEAWDENIESFLNKYGYIEPDLGLGASIKIPKEFLRDLSKNNLYEIFDNNKFGHTDLEFVHGQLDPVVDLKYSTEFAKRFGFKINVIPGEGHSICDKAQSPDKVAAFALEFFNK